MFPSYVVEALMSRNLRLLLTAVAAVAAGFSAAQGWAQELKPAVKSAAKPAKKSDIKYIRVTRNEKEEPQALQTSVIRFIPKFAEVGKSELEIDLIGAVHVGEKSYYEELNRRFTKYDAVLYELVAPEGKKPPKDGEKGVPTHPVAGLQVGMQSMLDLEHQLQHIDYHQANFVHADMSPEEFDKKMKDRGESFMQMFFRAMGHGLAQQGKKENSGKDADLFFALFSKDRPLKMKRAMAEQFDNMEEQMLALEGENGSTIITERNRKALEVLRREIGNGKKKIGIFYGAGHFPDMEERLGEEFGLKRVNEEWITAWKLVK
jgi:hypothetical protein